ncbi:MAG: hypothetical protein BWY09_01504 [Candidatus Hydrogenedentes bacterium ADurb.Bin179]|nr:MAG: hypothetical protein BWY09_01504 [Candidatus Hydrogenedentes bacterium ADurb.Bin179]
MTRAEQTSVHPVHTVHKNDPTAPTHEPGLTKHEPGFMQSPVKTGVIAWDLDWHEDCS